MHLVDIKVKFDLMMDYNTNLDVPITNDFYITLFHKEVKDNEVYHTWTNEFIIRNHIINICHQKVLPRIQLQYENTCRLLCSQPLLLVEC